MTDKKQRVIQHPMKEGANLAQVATEYILDPKTLGAIVVDGNASSVASQVDMEFAREVIGTGIEEIKKGDLSKLEEMLYSQAVALNMMFSNLSMRATIQTNVDIRSSLTNLALKSQNQSRNTIQTLINLKQPNQTAFIKQQTNVAHGHQQINNRVSPENLPNKPNELLEVQDGKWLDAGTKGQNALTDSTMEALGEVHRGKDS